MISMPDRHWEAAAAREPYFTVFTSPKFLRANFTPAHQQEFFDTGNRFVESAFRVIEARLVPRFTPVSILEYGCGVGRLAIPFARHAESVVAVDHSSAMLDVARQEAQRRGIANIEFLTASQFNGNRRKFDVVNCYLVFQRMPQKVGVALLRELLGRLGAGGIGIFHFACRSNTSRLIDASRRLRSGVPVLNGVANWMRGKRFWDPIVLRYTYHFDDILQALHDASISSQYIMFEDPSSALVFVQGPASYTRSVDERAGARDRQALVDVRELIARTSIEDLNRAADGYFASLSGWDHHLAKPFGNLDETPGLLIRAGALLQGLKLAPDTTVLEFGAGSGWLSRFLTQGGCHTILLDVSDTALQVARELYQRLPVIGDRPEPRFLLFDGKHIDLPDASVDRVLCFDAFHHVPNPEVVIAEIARILRPGGIAGFAEPGPLHSRSAMSQFEMRTYGVVENDIDMHAIRQAAFACGFTDLRLLVFHEPLFEVSVDEYEDLVAGGETCAKWVTATRGFLRSVRTFVLVKGDSTQADSRSVEGLSCAIEATICDSDSIEEGREFSVEIAAANTGSAVWLPSSTPVGGVALGVHLYDASRRLVRFDYHVESLERQHTIAPGEKVQCRAVLPALKAGRYLLEFDCVASRVIWFAQVGSPALVVPLTVRPKT